MAMNALRLPARFAALTASAGAAAVTARRHRPGFVDGQVTAAVLVTVQLSDRPPCAIRIAHFHERESARLTGGAVANDRHGAHRAGALEQRLQVRLAGFVRQVSDIQLRTHELLLHPEGWGESDGRLERNAR